MTLDAALAIGHHLAVFGILAVLVAEAALVRPGVDAADVRRIGRIDSAYGALAAAVLAVGASRVAWGVKPASFYLDNPVFWTKMNGFLVIGLLSIWPTIRFIRWRRADAAPPEAEVRTARRLVHLQLGLFFALPVLAALMARGIGH
jgi:putative membrane protein